MRLCFGVWSLQLWKWVSLSPATEMASSLCIVGFLCGWVVLKTVVTVFSPSPSLPGLEQQPTVWGMQTQIHYPRKSSLVLIRYDFTYSHRTVPKGNLLPVGMPQNKILDFMTWGWFQSYSVQYLKFSSLSFSPKKLDILCVLYWKEVKSLLWMGDLSSKCF